MQPTTSRPRILVARSVIDLLQRQGARPQLQLSGPHHQSIGGILIGKRVASDAVAVVAASMPGPTPDNRQLGFALDQGLANSTLEQWFARDPAVDFLGLWHTDPGGIGRPSDGDIEVARRLLADPAYNLTELVNLILYIDRAVPTIRAFYLSHASPDAPVGFAAHEVLDDDHPLLTGQKVAPAAGQTSRSASPASSSLRWPMMGRWLAAVAALVIAILLVFLFLTRRPSSTGGASPLPGGATSSATSAALTVSPGTEGTQSAPSPPPDAGNVLPTTPKAATATPSAVAEASPVPSASSTAGPAYALQFEPMDAAYRQGFLRRLQLAKCVGCYNVDLVSPVPFREMRLKIAGSTGAPFSNFAAPSPLQLPARTQPYTLQAFDLQGNALSEPVALAVTTGNLYVLRIVAR